MKWIDVSEERPGSQRGINYVARDVGPWDEVRVCRVSMAADARWTIHMRTGDHWRQAPIELDGYREAMAVVEEAARSIGVRTLVAAADKMEAAAKRARSLAFDEARKAVAGAVETSGSRVVPPGVVDLVQRARRRG